MTIISIFTAALALRSRCLVIGSREKEEREREEREREREEKEEKEREEEQREEEELLVEEKWEFVVEEEEEEKTFLALNSSPRLPMEIMVLFIPLSTLINHAQGLLLLLQGVPEILCPIISPPRLAINAWLPLVVKMCLFVFFYVSSRRTLRRTGLERM